MKTIKKYKHYYFLRNNSSVSENRPWDGNVQRSPRRIFSVSGYIHAHLLPSMQMPVSETAYGRSGSPGSRRSGGRRLFQIGRAHV